jgi:hypothetical protein
MPINCAPLPNKLMTRSGAGNAKAGPGNKRQKITTMNCPLLSDKKRIEFEEGLCAIRIFFECQMSPIELEDGFPPCILAHLTKCGDAILCSVAGIQHGMLCTCARKNVDASGRMLLQSICLRNIAPQHSQSRYYLLIKSQVSRSMSEKLVGGECLWHALNAIAVHTFAI